MNWAASCLATTRHFWGTVQGFYRWKKGREEDSSKRKDDFSSGHVCLRERDTKAFIMQIASSKSRVGMERAHVTDDLIDTDQKIPGWLTKMTLLGEVEAAVSLDIKSMLIPWALTWGTSFWACSFLFNMKTKIGGGREKERNQNRNRYMDPKKEKNLFIIFAHLLYSIINVLFDLEKFLI